MEVGQLPKKKGVFFGWNTQKTGNLNKFAAYSFWFGDDYKFGMPGREDDDYDERHISS